MAYKSARSMELEAAGMTGEGSNCRGVISIKGC